MRNTKKLHGLVPFLSRNNNNKVSNYLKKKLIN